MASQLLLRSRHPKPPGRGCGRGKKLWEGALALEGQRALGSCFDPGETMGLQETTGGGPWISYQRVPHQWDGVHCAVALDQAEDSLKELEGKEEDIQTDLEDSKETLAADLLSFCDLLGALRGAFRPPAPLYPDTSGQHYPE